MAFLLTACGSAPGPPAEGAQEPAPDSTNPLFQAGAWEAQTRVDSIESPDIAPEDVEAAKAELLAQYSGHSFCLAPEEVHRPPQQFFSGSAEGYRYESLQLAGGGISGAIQCDQDSALHNVEFDGTYTAVTYSLRARNTLLSPDRSRRVTLILSSEARRLGDC